MALSLGEEFISSFHSLQGVTIGERRKNLFNLLNKTQQSSESACPEINFTHLYPQNALEENFKVEALLYFRKVSDLLEVLKSENPILIEKVLKANSWFIKAAFEDVSGEYLVKQIFPHLSYNTKLKLLHKLSLYLDNIKKSDEFFNAIKETYGLYMATKLLPSCSENIILKYVDSYRVEIAPKQLLIIIKKYPSLTENILEKLHQHDKEVNIGSKYEFVFVYLMQHHNSLFLILNERYNLNFHLGSRASKKFIQKNKTNMINKPKKLYKLLNKKQIQAYIKDDFADFFLNIFPQSISELKENYEEYLSWLQHLPSDAHKLKLLQKTFKRVHGNELLDYPIFVLPKTMELLSTDEREEWIGIHNKPEEILEEDWISFMKTEKSVPLLKKKIFFTSNVKDRAKLIVSLVFTCKINKDLTALEDVCSYVLSKHRNDHVKVRQRFLATVEESFDLLKLNFNHWKYLIELIRLFGINQEFDMGCINMFETYIQYCLINNLPVEEHLKYWTKLEYAIYRICEKNPLVCEKKCLLLFKDLIPMCYKTKDLDSYYLTYLQYIIRWNKDHPKDKISLFKSEEAINAVKSKLQNPQYIYPADEIASQCIMFDFERSMQANLIPLLLNQKLDDSTHLAMINWLIKHRPQTLIDYLEPLIRNLVDMYSPLKSLNTFFRNYHHLEIPQKISSICLDIINDKQNDFDNKKKVAVFILSYVMKPSDFLNFAAAYYPADLIIDIASKEGQNIYKIQQAIPPCLRKIIPPYVTKDSLLNFCKGDYLKLTQKSLYSVMQNVAETRLAAIFNILIERSVSVRKHVIFLAFKLLNKPEACKILTKIMASEKNLSMRKHLFKSAFNFFLRNPDDYSWGLVKENLKTVDVNDTEAFHKLTKSKKIPVQYFVQYILFTWGALEQLPVNKKIDEVKCRILDGITSTKITLLPDKFCTEIIEKYFFQEKGFTDFQRAVHCFTCKYIVYSAPKSQLERSRFTLYLIKERMKCLCLVHHKFLYNFIQELCSHIRLRKTENDSLSSLLIFWSTELPPHEYFNEYLILQFTQISVTCTHEQNYAFKIGEQIVILCTYLESKQLLNMPIFSSLLDAFIPHFLLNDPVTDEKLTEFKLILAEDILKISTSNHCLLLALTLLPNGFLADPKLKNKYTLIDIIAKCQETQVQIHFHNYLKTKLWK